ncbi:hypothetical protein ANN_21302 [Periplaneta americana]|uniref:Uncharacterized protein n=1 Tax=Periplaneta americana TaxID=6978 RepID=A0ABQ8SFM9_PERAM|nr:hypothetical protein ANN_21302 [Periplaneta americana]
MAGLCEGGNEPPGSLKAIKVRISKRKTKVLRKIFGAKRNEVTGEWRKYSELKKMKPVVKIQVKLKEEGYKETECEISRKELEIGDDIYHLSKNYGSEAV